MPNAGLLSSAEKIGEWNKVELNVTSEHWHQLTSFNRYRHRYELSLAATALHQDTKHAYIDWKSHAVGNTPLKSKHSHSFTHSLTLSFLTLFFTVSLPHSRSQNKVCISLIAIDCCILAAHPLIVAFKPRCGLQM